jgi:hypothetical protein
MMRDTASNNRYGMMEARFNAERVGSWQAASRIRHYTPADARPIGSACQKLLTRHGRCFINQHARLFTLPFTLYAIAAIHKIFTTWCFGCTLSWVLG